MMSTSSQPSHKVQSILESKLKNAFHPEYLQIVNESHKHNVPNDSETHFKVVVVSSQFDTATSLVARHRMVNQCLADELAGPIHALSIVAWTTEQWQSKRETLDDGTITYQPEPSPACRGGDGSLPSKRG